MGVLKKACPRYAVNAAQGTVSGGYGMQPFVQQLKRNKNAVEAAVEQTLSHGPVEVRLCGAFLKSVTSFLLPNAG